MTDATNSAPLIYQALANVMGECTHVLKKDRNEHQRFLFRGIDAVVNAVGPILRKHQVIVLPDVQSVTYETVQTTTGKATTACRVLVDYRFFAVDGSSVTARVIAEAFDSGDKGAPKAMSVAFRTALLQALALPTDEPDPDSSTHELAAAPAEATPAPQAKRMSRNRAPAPAAPNGNETGEMVTQPQLAKMHAMFTEAGTTEREDMLFYCQAKINREITSSKEMTLHEGSLVIDALTADKGGNR